MALKQTLSFSQNSRLWRISAVRSQPWNSNVCCRSEIRDEVWGFYNWCRSLPLEERKSLTFVTYRFLLANNLLPAISQTSTPAPASGGMDGFNGASYPNCGNVGGDGSRYVMDVEDMALMGGDTTIPMGMGGSHNSGASYSSGVGIGGSQTMVPSGLTLAQPLRPVGHDPEDASWFNGVSVVIPSVEGGRTFDHGGSSSGCPTKRVQPVFCGGMSEVPSSLVRYAVPSAPYHEAPDPVQFLTDAFSNWGSLVESRPPLFDEQAVRNLSDGSELTIQACLKLLFGANQLANDLTYMRKVCVSEEDDAKSLKLEVGRLKKELQAIEGALTACQSQLEEVRALKQNELAAKNALYAQVHAELIEARGKLEDVVALVEALKHTPLFVTLAQANMRNGVAWAIKRFKRDHTAIPVEHYLYFFDQAVAQYNQRVPAPAAARVSTLTLVLSTSSNDQSVSESDELMTECDNRVTTRSSAARSGSNRAGSSSRNPCPN